MAPILTPREAVLAHLAAYEEAVREDMHAQTPATLVAVRETRRALIRAIAAACPDLMAVEA